MKYFQNKHMEIGKKIFYRGARTDHDSESRRKIFLFNVFSQVAIICLLALGTAAFIQGNPLLGYADLSMALFVFLLVLYLHYSGNQAFCSNVAVLMTIVFFCYLFSSGGVNSTSFMWLYTYPTLAFFLLNLFWGSMTTLLLLAFAVAFLLFDLSSETINLYNVDFAIRFVPTYLVVFLFSFFLERDRVRTHQNLLQKQEVLTRLVDQLKNKEIQLQAAQDKLEQRVAERTAKLLDINEKFRNEIEVRKAAEQDRFRLESELSRAQKMELLGILAGGVAHDLNNVLIGIVSYPEMLLKTLPADDPMHDPLDRIRKSGKNAAAIVQDLLALARRGVMIKDVISLNEVLQEYFESPEHAQLCNTHPGVALKQQLDNNLPLIEGSAIHLQNVAMNLVNNAFEAVNSDGVVTARTSQKILKSAVKGYEEIRNGEYAVLTVEDNGPGMSQEVVEKIFEPFFTRKNLGRSGTGLGMTIVWGTIKDHGGYIDIDSAPGRGTVISVYFPLSAQQSTMKKAELAEPEQLYRGNGERVLIVDDISEQREIGVEILEMLGYKATAVTSGEEAVAFLENQPVDLILLDMIMPSGMDGLETYQKILSINPSQKAVLVSGFSENSRVREALRLGIRGYLKKPYTLEQLSQMVNLELSK